MKFSAYLFCWLALATAPALAAPAEPDAAASLQSGSVLDAAERLKPGQFLWAPQIAPSGPVLLVVSLATQRAVVYRNGVPIGISTVSTGRPGYETPTGTFLILQKRVEHYSNIYDNAPMPYMQRLTWGGVALHAGQLPGYPASHGCIRLPLEFARLLYDVTHHGMTVVITDRPAVPRIAPADALLAAPGAGASLATSMWWKPDRSPAGPLSVIVSAADRRAVVLRNGVVIGHAAVTIDGPITQTTAYVLNAVVEGRRSWTRIVLPGQDGGATEALRGRVEVAEAFRSLVEPLLTVGTTAIVTGDSLRGAEPGQALTVIEADQPANGK
jgi:hypothetical protein